MAYSIIVIPLMIIIGAICISLPIIIGTYVYRDAKQRGMNPTLWTLLAVLAPGFIGFIIYLIVRGESSGLHCPVCGKNVRHNFSVCPYCSSSLKAKCSRCGFVLEPGWETCPNCAEPIPPEQRVAIMPMQTNDRHLRSILIVAILIPLILCAMLIFGAMAFRASSDSGVGMITKELKKSSIMSSEIEKWMKECDEEGTGIYVLKSLNLDKSETEALVYCNYKTAFASSEISNGYLFRKPTMSFTLVPETYIDEDEKQNYLLYCINADIVKDYNISIKDVNGNKLEYKLEDAQSIGLEDGILQLDEPTLSLDFSVADNVKLVYEISWTLWSGNNPVNSGGGMNANGDYLDESISFSESFIKENNADAFSFELLGKNGKTIFKSKKYKITGDYDECFGFNIGYDQNGKLGIIGQYHE